MALIHRLTLAGLVAAGCAAAPPATTRYIRWAEIQPILSALTEAGAPNFAGAGEWDNWIRDRDVEIRGRVDRGIEDSISSLILFGGSFTALPRFGDVQDAVNAAGDLTENARARVDTFLQALDEKDDERYRITLDFLRRRRITQDEVKPFLTGNLRRYALDQTSFRHMRKNTEVTARFEGGIPGDASLLANFAIEDTLQYLKTKGALPGRIRRVAVLGPGFDLGGAPDSSDFYPPQSLQPFALLDAVLKLGLAQPAEIQMTAFDLNPLVLANIRAAAAKARAGQRLTLQLWRPASVDWTAEAITYFEHLGDAIGTATQPAITPPGWAVRAVALKPQIAARVAIEDLNIVTQTVEGQTFDLVIATGLFDYYSRQAQTLALANIAKLLSSGGILLADGVLQSVKSPDLEALGEREVRFTKSGTAADTIATFRRK